MKEFHGLDEEPEYGQIINSCKRYIGSAYWHLFKYFFKQNRYRYFDFAERLTQPLHPKVLFKERYTTPIPREDAPYYYDLRSGKITVPQGQWYKMPLGGVTFICIFYSLKRRSIEKRTLIGVTFSTRYQAALTSRKKIA